MHLLTAQPGLISDGDEPLDLIQEPGELLILSAAETDLAILSAALPARLPSARLCNWLQLKHPYSLDAYLERMLPTTKTVVVRLLGGKAYWPYGVEQLQMSGAAVYFLPGDDKDDPETFALNKDPAMARTLWAYLAQGGVDNAQEFWRVLAGQDALPPRPVLEMGVFDEAAGPAPVGIVFYRAHFLAGNTMPIAQLCEALKATGYRALYVSSLKDPNVVALVRKKLQGVCAIIVTTGFSVSKPGAIFTVEAFDGLNVPIIQGIHASCTKSQWQESARGLGPRDVAMNVALPEVDGRILGNIVSFKSEGQHDLRTDCYITAYEAHIPGIETTVARAIGVQDIRNGKPVLILANYPNRDGRLANGVGLDTPESAVQILHALGDETFATGADLMARLRRVTTNAKRGAGLIWPVSSYTPAQEVSDHWGVVADDPFVEGKHFHLPILELDKAFLMIQPARGYNIDPEATYHDAALVPPHGYVAAYAALKDQGVRDFIHVGKHGNLEWLPGKAVGLSPQCWPEAILQGARNFYPFIINDPGEGTQAKRRLGSTIISHLTPPLTRAETYGDLATLERLVDEFYLALQGDPRRSDLLKDQILGQVRHLGLYKDLGVKADASEDEQLGALDGYLCELKELQIRDGLHILGKAPEGGQRRDLLLALLRLESGERPSFLKALADDLGLGFDPLTANLAAPWTGPKPTALTSDNPWRTVGDTVERLELYGRNLLEDTGDFKAPGPKSLAIQTQYAPDLAGKLEESAFDEIANLMGGLKGRFVPPSSSGAPTRGREDVLPTGRNFYSVDPRSLPTPAAWRLGWESAALLLDLHRQDHGAYPKALVVSAWGTANMRTGGDDLAQVLALMGCQPTWDDASGRVTGFDVLPLTVLDRPRVDVTLRVSGFFRDAFPAQIDLIDSAARKVIEQDEPIHLNPARARYLSEVKAGVEERLAASRVYGSRPGAYGAGLQALIDEGGWQTAEDLGESYINWSAYAYGAGQEGTRAETAFRQRLSQAEALIQNQDNREHDILDSDDYYQFMGGAMAAIAKERGLAPIAYLNDHSRPQRPRIQTLKSEIGKIVRGRAANPKWIKGCMRHGYKGAFEMAATLDYLFAFAATTGLVEGHHFDQLYSAYLEDQEVQAWIEEVNPEALKEMKVRFQEALDRGLWRSRLNQIELL